MKNDNFFKEGNAYIYLKNKNEVVVFNKSKDDIDDFIDVLEKAGMELFYSKLIDENVIIGNKKVYRLGILTDYGVIKYDFKGKMTANAIDTWEGELILSIQKRLRKLS